MSFPPHSRKQKARDLGSGIEPGPGLPLLLSLGAQHTLPPQLQMQGRGHPPLFLRSPALQAASPFPRGCCSLPSILISFAA